MAGMTTRELLEKLYNQDYEKLKGKKLRMTRVRVPGKEVCLAHVINPSQSCIYQNLGLHIGVHEGFMDRFSGSLILTGGLTEVQTAVEEVVKFFREVLGFKTCAVHKS